MLVGYLGPKWIFYPWCGEFHIAFQLQPLPSSSAYENHEIRFCGCPSWKLDWRCPRDHWLPLSSRDTIQAAKKCHPSSNSLGIKRPPYLGPSDHPGLAQGEGLSKGHIRMWPWKWRLLGQPMRPAMWQSIQTGITLLPLWQQPGVRLGSPGQRHPRNRGHLYTFWF